MAPGVYEVILDKPLGIVFEEVGVQMIRQNAFSFALAPACADVLIARYEFELTAVGPSLNFFLCFIFLRVQCVGGLAKGVRVAELVEGGNAATCGTAIGTGDELVAVTAVKVCEA